MSYPNDTAHLRVALELEHQQLLIWSERTGYLSGEDGLSGVKKALKKDHMMLHQLLSNICTDLDDFKDLHAFYKELNPGISKEQQLASLEEDIVKEAGSLKLSYEKNQSARKHLKGLKHLIRGTKSVTDVVAQPRRLVWASVGKNHFEELLGKLRTNRELLYNWMDDYVQFAILENTKSTCLEMLNVRDEISELKHLLEAMAFLNYHHQSHQEIDTESMSTKFDLEALTRFKISTEEYVKDEDKIHRESHETKKDRTQIKSVKEIDEFHASAELSDGLEQSVDVWIEWKTYVRENYEDAKGNIVRGAPSNFTGRVRELVSLLSFHQPPELCMPMCLGYYDDYEDRERKARFGIILAKPHQVGKATTQRSLFTLLTSLPTPSLTDRIKLSQKLTSCLLYLHTVGWIHKGFRSETITFFTNEDEQYDFTRLLVSGFDHSRPDQEDTVTDSIKIRPRTELYKHPLSQGKVPREHGCKLFDIYALGLILLEVAY